MVDHRRGSPFQPGCPFCGKPMICYEARRIYRCPECDIDLHYIPNKIQSLATRVRKEE